MSTKQTAFIAVIVTGFCASVLAAITTTPELITELIVGIGAFLAAGIVLSVLLWTPWLRALPPEQQRRTLWIAAGSTGLVVCLLPQVIWTLTR